MTLRQQSWKAEQRAGVLGGVSHLSERKFAIPTISVILAELERFTKTLQECSCERDYLFYWFLNSGTLESIPEEIERGSGYLRDLAKATELASMDKNQKLKFESEMINELDRSYQMRQERKEGREEGAREKSLSVAKKMLEDGVTAELIEKYTGLPVEEINKL